MAIVINDPYARGGGGVAGQQVGGQIGNALQMLAQQKLQHMQDRYARSQELKNIQQAGYNPQEAALLNMFKAHPQSMLQAMSMLQGQGGEEQESPMQTLMPQSAPIPMAPERVPVKAVTPKAAGSMPAKMAAAPVLAQQAQAQQAQKAAQLAPAQQAQAQQAAQAAAPQMPAAAPKKILTPAQRIAQAGTAQEKARIHKEQASIDKETLPVYNEITKSGHDAKENVKRLDRMQTLLDKGNLSTSMWNGVLDYLDHKWDIDLSALQNADSQEFRKLSKDFLKNAKSIFGSRMTDVDLTNFLQTVPTLSLSNEGKQRVINNMKNLEEGKLIKAKAMQEVIKENGGRRPRNLDMLIDERVAPQLDKLAQGFSAGTYGKQAAQQESNNIPGTDLWNPLSLFK